MKLVLCGGLDSALTHFAMIGLAGILEEAGATRVRLWWQDGPQAEPCLSWDGLDAGEAVHDHASRHASSGDLSTVPVTTSVTTSAASLISAIVGKNLQVRRQRKIAFCKTTPSRSANALA